MQRPALLLVLLTIFLGTGFVATQAQDTSVADTISARRSLMAQLSSLQALIEDRIASGEYSPELYDLGQATAASLRAFAVLLPPETNLQGGAPAVEGTETTAAAAIWDDLPAFQRLLNDIATQAEAASEAADLAEFQAKWEKVAEACSSCHDSYVAFDPFAALN